MWGKRICKSYQGYPAKVAAAAVKEGASCEEAAAVAAPLAAYEAQWAEVATARGISDDPAYDGPAPPPRWCQDRFGSKNNASYEAIGLQRQPWPNGAPQPANVEGPRSCLKGHLDGRGVAQLAVPPCTPWFPSTPWRDRPQGRPGVARPPTSSRRSWACR